MNFLFGKNSNSKALKSKKLLPDQSASQVNLSENAETLPCVDLTKVVKLPTHEDLDEWIAINTVDFFNQIIMLYGTLTDFCNETNCPVMSAGPKYEYLWADGQSTKKPVKMSAPNYIESLMSWVQNQLENETIFPSKIGIPFPKDFQQVAKQILKRLFRVYAHIYYQHFREVITLQIEPHLNTSFKHFILFVTEFNLVELRELAPLQRRIELLCADSSQEII